MYVFFEEQGNLEYSLMFDTLTCMLLPTTTGTCFDVFWIEPTGKLLNVLSKHAWSVKITLLFSDINYSKLTFNNFIRYPRFHVGDSYPFWF